MSKGFDLLPINQQLDLCLPMAEYMGGAGAVTLDRSINHLPFALTGAPTWAIPGPPTSIRCLNFVQGNPDFLQCDGAVAAPLDYTSEDFSIVAWVNPSTLVGDLMLYCRGFLQTDGFYVRCMAAGHVILSCNQAAAQQNISSALGEIAINTWTLIGISRDGILGQIFINGVETVYTLQDDLVNPLTSNRKALVGIYDNETDTPWAQYIWNFRMWGDRALTLEDHKYIFETERYLLGV